MYPGSHGGSITKEQVYDLKTYQNVSAQGELLEEATVANFATTAADGKTDPVDHYYLSAKRSARVIRATRSSSVRFLASSFSLQTNCGSLMSASKNSLGVTPR